MRIERDETSKAYFDEIIGGFASIKARNVLFQLPFFCSLISPKKAGYSYVSMEVCFSNTRGMTCIYYEIQIKCVPLSFAVACSLFFLYDIQFCQALLCRPINYDNNYGVVLSS